MECPQILLYLFKTNTIMSKFILRGNKILLDKPEKKEKEEGKLDLIIPDNLEKDN